MHSRLIQVFALLAAGAATPLLHGTTITFEYTAPNVGLASVSGFGMFSYSGTLSSIAKANLTSFAFELDITASGAVPPTATFDYGLSDLLTFSATSAGGVITGLSLSTDFEAASNTSNFDENQKNLIVNSLAPNGAFNQNDNTVLTQTTLYDTGTITITPEPSTALLAGAGALLLLFGRRTLRARQG